MAPEEVTGACSGMRSGLPLASLKQALWYTVGPLWAGSGQGLSAPGHPGHFIARIPAGRGDGNFRGGDLSPNVVSESTSGFAHAKSA